MLVIVGKALALKCERERAADIAAVKRYMALERERSGDQRGFAERGRLLVAADREYEGRGGVLAEGRAGVRQRGRHLRRIEDSDVLAIELLR